MARIATATTLIAIIFSCIGCGTGTYSGGTYITPTDFGGVDLSNVNEIDLAEKVAKTRTEYQAALEILADYYARTGNNRKLTWAQKELTSMHKVPDYPYVENVIPGPELKARMATPEANALFLDAEKNQRSAGMAPFGGVVMPYIRNSNLLRYALDQYTRLIKLYPASDKIDDAAFQAGYIHEHFKEYDIALTYYQRAYQWDSMTPNPARFRAAYLLDNRLNRKSEALELYQEAMAVEGVRYYKWQEYAQDRINVLTGITPSFR